METGAAMDPEECDDTFLMSVMALLAVAVTWAALFLPLLL
jgi:hypothetical protein